MTGPQLPGDTAKVIESRATNRSRSPRPRPPPRVTAPRETGLKRAGRQFSPRKRVLLQTPMVLAPTDLRNNQSNTSGIDIVLRLAQIRLVVGSQLGAE
jgi:hypothetical protein